MIISHRLGAVLVKTKKTAGTSVEIALSTVCGPDDVITPIVEEDEQVRQELGGCGPQNYLVPLRELPVRTAIKVALGHSTRPRRFYNHISASEAIRYIGQDTWDRYFTFTIERNPWDKAVSRYFWEARRKALPDFSTFLRQRPPNRFSCFDLYSNEGTIVVNEVVVFEELADVLPRIWDRLGVKPPSLPRAKGSYRPRGLDYRTMYSDDDAEFIASICHREIAAFDYAF
jgi:hypothetical protein